MMLDPLSILFGRSLRYPEGTKKLDHEAMPPPCHLRQLAPRLGQKNRPVRAMLDQTIALQPCDGAGDRCRCDP